jgi:hypothetical protein
MLHISPLSTLFNRPNYKNLLVEEHYYDAQEHYYDAQEHYYDAKQHYYDAQEHHYDAQKLKS